MIMPITAAILFYCIAWGLLMRAASRRLPQPSAYLPWLLAAGLLMHAAGIYQQIVVPAGYQLALFKIVSLFFWASNFLILASSLRKPLHNLFLITLPLTVLALLASLYGDSRTVEPIAGLTWGTAGHILLSILAYSVMIIATLQALVLAYQNYNLRHRHPGGLLRLLPPLQTMETLLFEMLWTGQILLTLVIITGSFQVDDLAGQHLHHKITFTVIAWMIYAVLLWGRYALGWRGNAAIRWTLSGFAFLLLAYMGSKVVLELVLGIR